MKSAEQNKDELSEVDRHGTSSEADIVSLLSVIAHTLLRIEQRLSTVIRTPASKDQG